MRSPFTPISVSRDIYPHNSEFMAAIYNTKSIILNKHKIRSSSATIDHRAFDI